eukprot:scaffold2473_cov247-Pinguiococcus_pyrenoidosus.AAC.19
MAYVPKSFRQAVSLGSLRASCTSRILLSSRSPQRFSSSASFSRRPCKTRASATRSCSAKAAGEGPGRSHPSSCDQIKLVRPMCKAFTFSDSSRGLRTPSEASDWADTVLTARAIRSQN